MSEFGRELARLMEAHGIGVRELARAIPCNPGHVSSMRSGRDRPSPGMAARLDEVLAAGGALIALARDGNTAAAPDEITALELARRAEASDVGDGMCERLELAVDDLATAYPRNPPGELLGRVRTYLGYVTGLADARATLIQRRRLLVSGGWLSLLAATCLIDLHQDHAATMHLRTVAQLAHETEHVEIGAWVLETRAWQLLTAGAYREAAGLSRAAQEAAPAASSVRIQAIAQEGRAWARLGDARQARAALTAVERLVSPLPPPERPEHHYVYDPPKARVYVATTLAWLGDSAAEPAARDILGALLADDPPRPRRIALAQLDLALTLTAAGKHDEAAARALGAVGSGHLAPVDQPRVREITAAVTARHAPGSAELSAAYRGGFSEPPPALL